MVEIISSDDSVIKIRGLTVAFGEQTVLEKLNLDVRRGEILGVVGGSGTGKSVLMRTIIGLNKPQTGSIEIFGERLHGLSQAAQRALGCRWACCFRTARCLPR